jgi:fused signal recognition particle receptor
MFSFIKNSLSNLYSSFTTKVSSLFSRATIDQETLKDLERLLIEADTGYQTTQTILQSLQKKFQQGTLKEGQDLKKALQEELLQMLYSFEYKTTQIYLLVGINGSGKTTFAAKLAYKMLQEGKKVLLAAGDTFRAAATEQLALWTEKMGAELVKGKQGQEPGSVVFQACEAYKAGKQDVLIIDTAGRLQTKINLMQELAKLKRIIQKQLPDVQICTLLTLDAMLGQNSLEQAKIFNESTKVDGIVLSKMDGTGKGGIIFAINHEIKIPVAFISFGEKIDQLKQFNAQEYVEQLLTE